MRPNLRSHGKKGKKHNIVEQSKQANTCSVPVTSVHRCKTTVRTHSFHNGAAMDPWTPSRFHQLLCYDERVCERAVTVSKDSWMHHSQREWNPNTESLSMCQ
mmetsp:Transcript_27167/g.63602  ORF Transcript_27167/g.63602 Transcript_27167/m.63602 type:complete len:102 (+) Transcript_27167:138-443(+)